MIMDIEDELRAGMRIHVAGVVLTTDLVGAAAQRNRRRIIVQRSMYAAGIAGLAGALAAVVAIGGGAAGVGDQGPGTGQPAVAADSPQLQLAAAVAASENISYRIRVTAGTKEDPDGEGSSEGAYDPATRSGYLNSPQAGSSTVYIQRLVNGELYLGSNNSPTWKQEPSNGKFEYGDALQGAATASGDPEELFKVLRQAGTEVRKTGAVYHFESSTPLDTKYFATGTATLVGDVTLDANGRIAKVAIQEAQKGQFKPGVKGGGTFDSSHVVTVELFDYGTSVTVDKPADVIVAK
jgi:hypothetical protein